MRSNVVFLKSLITALTLLLLIVAPAVAKDTSTLTQDSIDSVYVLSDDEDGVGEDGDEMAEDEFHCDGLPDHDALTDALVEVVENGENGGFALHMWATIVDRDGEVCNVTFSGEEPGDQWPGSRVISAQKANTANAFSLPGLALSTANLFTAVQPGNSLFGLQFSNPVDTAVAYAGDGALFGSADDPMVGHRIGGVNVFGGGLALYDVDGILLGALGTSGDSSCTDHIIAWKVRDALGLDNVPGGVSETGDDNIVYDAESGWAHPECGLGEVEISETLPEAYPIGADEDLSAEAQADQLIEELVTTVMDVTASVTEENADDLSAAVSELLASQSVYRLIGDADPLGADSQTLDEFEEQALLAALDGETTQEVVDGELRTVVPLTFSQADATANCAVCHANYDTLVSSADETIVVGAAAFRVPADEE